MGFEGEQFLPTPENPLPFVPGKIRKFKIIHRIFVISLCSVNYCRIISLIYDIVLYTFYHCSFCKSSFSQKLRKKDTRIFIRLTNIVIST
jgi:hypothetical protein